MSGLGMNELALEIAEHLIEQAPRFRVASHSLANGARVVDCGSNIAGGYDAGLALAEICMGGLGTVALASLEIGDDIWPGVIVSTDHPMISCMASQYAGWAINVDGFFAMGSGPLRAHARVEKELFNELGYEEEADHGVLVLETRQLPTEAVAAWIASRARLSPEQLTLLLAPTASLAGTVQISARIVETAMHKMEQLGFDLAKVVSGFGTAPLPPVARNDLKAIGRTNDCILYGGTVYFTVNAGDAELAPLAEQLPASASRDYGTPFYDIFERYERDFYRIDPLLFSPAEVHLTSAETGNTFHGGSLNPGVLRASCYPA